MKITIIAAAFVLLCCGSTDSIVAQRTTLGILGGINRSKVTPFSDEAGASSRTGTHFGAYVQFDILGPVGFQLGGRYTQKGWNGISDEEDVTIGVAMPYFELPALLVITVPTGPAFPISPRVFGGPAAALRWSCELRRSAPRSESKTPCDQAGLTGISSFDVGLMAGGGLVITLGSNSFLLDFAHTRGLTTIDDNLKNSVLSFTAGMVIPLGGPY